MRFKTTILSLVAVATAVALVLAGGCKGSKPATTDTKGPAATQPAPKPPAPAPTPAPKPAETPKAESTWHWYNPFSWFGGKKTPAPPAKPDEKALKLKAAQDKLAAAEAYWSKNPKDFDGAKKQFEDAKAAAAGTEVEKKCTDMIAKVQAAKDKDAKEAKDRLDKEAKDKALKAAKEKYEAADAFWTKNPKDFDGAKKQFVDAKAVAAGTEYDKKCTDMIAKVDAAKDKEARDAKALLDKEGKAKAEKAAKEAYEKAQAYWEENPKDLDGTLKKLEEAKPVVAGTDYAKKVDAAIKDVNAAKEAKAKAPKPITESLTKAAEVKDAAEAWAKAEAAEKDKAQPERARLSAALPYYLAVLSWKDADGARDEKAAAAALRIGEIVKEYAQDEDEMFSAGKYFMAGAFIDLGSDAWQKAEKPYANVGKGAEYVETLRKLAKNAAARGEELSASPDGKAQGEKLKKFSASVAKKVDDLAAKYAPKK